MPALSNPRHERYAQAFFAGLGNGGTQHDAYKKAGYLVTNKASAKACASRLMLTIANRVRELQEEANDRLKPQIDLSRERVGQRLHKASTMAEQQENAAAMATCEMGIAKVFGHINTPQEQQQSFATARTSHDIGMRLLQACGLAEPDDLSIEAAIQLNNDFISGLEAIARQAQGLTLEQDDD